MRKSWWVGVVGLAVVLRLLASAFLYHTDLKGIYHETGLVLKYGWVEGYQEGVKENTPLHYPPPVYLIFGGYQRLGGFLFGNDFQKWVASPDLKFWVYKGALKDILLMKFPILLTDFLVAWILVRSVPENRRKLAAILWLFNPFTLYAIYGTSHFDIMPTAAIVAAAVSFRKRKTASYALLGLGAGFKVFPLLLLPFWLVFDDRRWARRLGDLAVAMAVLVVCLAPIIKSREALGSVFLSNLTGGVTRAAFDIGNHESLPIYPVAYGLLLLSAIFGYLRKVPLEAIPVAVFGGLFGLSNFHPQWMVWLMPFLLLLVVDGWLRWRLALLLLLSYWGVVFLINDIYMTFGILSPMNSAFASLPTARSLLDNFGIGDQLQAAFHALFLACLILAIAEILKGAKVNNNLRKLETISTLRLSLLWAGFLVIAMVVAHVFLSFKGVYVDGGHSGWRESVALTRETMIRQDFIVKHNNFLAIEVAVKNVGLKNKSDTYFNLVDQETGAVVPFRINGAAIGDDYNLRLNFSRIRQSGGHRYWLTISSPQAPSPVGGDSLFIPYDGANGGDGLFINGRNVKGSLAYTAYYNPGGLVDNLRYTLANIYSEI